MQSLFQASRSDYGFSVYSDHSVVPPRLDHLTIDTGWPKHPPDDSLAEFGPITTNGRIRQDERELSADKGGERLTGLDDIH